MSAIDTKLTVYHPDGRQEEMVVKLAPKPSYEALCAVVNPLVGGSLEHVTVRHNGERADMFVHETSAINGMPFNAEGSKIYRNNWLTQHPGADPDDLPPVCGVAVLFERRVWF